MQEQITDRFEVDPAPDGKPRGPRRFALPLGAVDAHAHVIGSQYIAQRSYTPRPAPAQAYLRMLDATGMTYGVLVQVSVHGTDNSLMLETLQAHRARLRGIAVVQPDASSHALRALKEAGVVGLRLNATTGGGVGVSALEDYDAICAEYGWHLQFLVHADMIARLAAKVSKLRVPAVFDHMGYVHPAVAQAEPGKTLLQLVRDGAWVKLSGGFRLSADDPPYADTIDFTCALAEAAPSRCVWGSDWPHVSFRGRMPNTGDLLDLLGESVPDPQVRHAVLVTNPQRLYGFPPAGATR